MPLRPRRRVRRPPFGARIRALVLVIASAGALACLPTATASARGVGLADRLAPLHARAARAGIAGHRAPSGRSRRAPSAGGRHRHAGDRHGHGHAYGHGHARRKAHSAARSKRGHRLLVLVDLRHMANHGAISRSDLRAYRHVYMQALHTLRRLQGTRHTELASVMNNLQEMAAAKDLTPTNLPSIFLTLRRNREWWTTKPLLSYGRRVTFPGSLLIWEYYPGEGIELQWLATFGEANGYYLSGDRPQALRQVLEEARELAVSRAGGLAWEYLFHFDGGSPPWTSGLAQGTAIQAYARASQSLTEPEFAQIAERSLGLFETPPPEGVRIATAAGAHYLEYSFAPRERILNGFIQAVTGLYDFSKVTGSRLGARLFEEGDAQARIEVPRYDTGAWSMYDQHTESDLGYHKLLTEFLHNLCGRTRNGPPLPPEGAPEGQAGATTSATGGVQPASTVSASGTGEGQPGAGGSEGSAAGPQQRPAAGNPIPGDEIYCTTAEHFETYLHTPPAIKLLSRRLRTGVRAGVRFSLSKISTISLTVRFKHKVIWTNKATVESGKPRLLWITPGRSGTYSVSATATDLAGNTSSASGTVRLAPTRRQGHGHEAHPHRTKANAPRKRGG